MGKKYSFIVGTDRSATMTYAFLDKGVGQTIISGPEQTIPNVRRGDCGVPNYTEAWGRRLKRSNGQVLKTEDIVDIKDASYKGDIEWLKWGDPNGSLISARYLKGYNTLDEQYQRLVLNSDANIRVDDESSADMYYLRFPNGDNELDEDTDTLLVQMLKIHAYNADSESKDPNNAPSPMFREEKAVHRENLSSKTIDQKFECLKMVNQASEDNSLVKLRNLFGIVGRLSGIEPKDMDLYAVLSKVADEKPEEFYRLIQDHKTEISNLFEKADAYKALDLSKNGTISVGQGNKKQVLVENIPCKGQEMVNWMVANFMDDRSFKSFVQLKVITDNLK